MRATETIAISVQLGNFLPAESDVVSNPLPAVIFAASVLDAGGAMRRGAKPVKLTEFPNDIKNFARELWLGKSATKTTAFRISCETGRDFPAAKTP